MISRSRHASQAAARQPASVLPLRRVASFAFTIATSRVRSPPCRADMALVLPSPLALALVLALTEGCPCRPCRCLPSSSPTVAAGVGVDVSKVEIKTNRGALELKLWDVAGSDEQSGLRETYYRGADAACIFFRFDALSTYWQVLKWHNELVRACGPGLPIVVCGLHADHADGKEGGALYGSPAVKVSCKSGNNMFAPLTFLLRQITADPSLKCKLASSKTQVPEAYDHHVMCEHITSTWQ
eukprot:SAG11_NODE_2536_length_3245_cov_3.417673_3_plen_241_part_00